MPVCHSTVCVSMSVSAAEAAAIAPLFLIWQQYTQGIYCHSIDSNPGNMQDNAATVRYILNGADIGP